VDGQARRARLADGTKAFVTAHETSDTCFYCEDPIEDFRSVKFQMPNSSISLHEGECWDLFVVAWRSSTIVLATSSPATRPRPAGRSLPVNGIELACVPALVRHQDGEGVADVAGIENVIDVRIRRKRALSVACNAGLATAHWSMRSTS
jgi:hypothetical protein